MARLDNVRLDGEWKDDLFEYRYTNKDGKVIGGGGFSFESLPIVIQFFIDALKARNIEITAIAEEREACAQIAECWFGDCADQIRARSQSKGKGNNE